MFAVTKQGTELTLLTSQLNTIPTGTQVSSGSIKESNPSFDFIAEPKATSSYASGKRYVNGETRIYIPFQIISSLIPIAVQDASSGSTGSSHIMVGVRSVTIEPCSGASNAKFPGKSLSEFTVNECMLVVKVAPD